MCRNSRVINFRFDRKTQWPMFLLLYGRHFGVPPKGTNMESSYKALQIKVKHLPKNARMNNRTYLNRDKVLYTSFIFHIPAYWFNSLNVTIVIFDSVTLQPSHCATKWAATYSAMIWRFLIPLVWHKSMHGSYNDPSKSTSSKVLETVASHLK